MSEEYTAVKDYQHEDVNHFPADEINILLSFISQNEYTLLTSETGEEIHIPSGDIFFLTQGAAEIRHAHGGSVIAVMDRAFPLGVMERYYSCNQLLYRAMTRCLIFCIKRSAWDGLIHSHKLEEQILTISSYAFFAMVRYASEVLSETTYRQIRRLLYLYDRKRELFISSGETVSSYIMARVSISKSQVMKILAELRKGGYISIDKGLLVSINRKLPEHF